MSQLDALHGNRILGILPAADLERLLPHLEPVQLERRFPLETADQPIQHVYFPDSGIVSIIAKSPLGREIEVGIIGRDGMTGLMVILGNDRSPHDTYIQVAGAGWRIGVSDLRAALRGSKTLRRVFSLYIQTFLIQMAYTVLANGRAQIEERLARWLIMANDRLGGDEVPLTHDFLGLILGVRRSGVTDTLHSLEGKGLIRSLRSLIKIIDRAGLEKTAGDSYGIPEAAYERLIGGFRGPLPPK